MCGHERYIRCWDERDADLGSGHYIPRLPIYIIALLLINIIILIT